MKKESPSVSIILPTRNEEKYIQQSLENIFAQTYPKDKIEVILIDGMSSDRTREIAQKFPVRILENPKRYIYPGLNIGIKNAQGEIIMRVDARTFVPKDYVQKCVQTLLLTRADNVGGMEAPFIPAQAGLVQRAVGLAMTHPFGAGNAPFRVSRKRGSADSVYLGCFRKEIFDKVGMFDEKAFVIAEDADFNWRIKKAGGKVYLNPDIIAYHLPRDSFSNLWEQYLRYGSARAAFFLKHKALKFRQIIPPTLLLSLPILILLGFINYIFLYVLVLLVGAYLATDIIVSLSLAFRQKNIMLFFALMLVFPCMHFAWASGFLNRMTYKPKSGTYWSAVKKNKNL